MGGAGVVAAAVASPPEASEVVAGAGVVAAGAGVVATGAGVVAAGSTARRGNLQLHPNKDQIGISDAVDLANGLNRCAIPQGDTIQIFPSLYHMHCLGLRAVGA